MLMSTMDIDIRVAGGESALVATRPTPELVPAKAAELVTAGATTVSRGVLR